jgi:dienelactone hydrolase
MPIKIRDVEYSIGGVAFSGACACNDGQTGRRPAILVFHGWEGRSEGQESIARTLAEMGYAGFACDVFGNGIRGDLAGDNSALIAPFFADRVLLRDQSRRNRQSRTSASRSRSGANRCDRVLFRRSLCSGPGALRNRHARRRELSWHVHASRGIAHRAHQGKGHGVSWLGRSVGAARGCRCARERNDGSACGLAAPRIRSHDACVHGARRESPGGWDPVQRTLGETSLGVARHVSAGIARRIETS